MAQAGPDSVGLLVVDRGGPLVPGVCMACAAGHQAAPSSRPPDVVVLVESRRRAWSPVADRCRRKNPLDDPTNCVAAWKRPIKRLQQQVFYALCCKQNEL